MKFAKEMYFAILLDRKSAKPMIIASAEGGTSIEDLAESNPEKIIKKYIDINDENGGIKERMRWIWRRSWDARIKMTPRNSFKRCTKRSKRRIAR